MEYNIYCDENCHLPNDHENKMVLGGIWVDIRHIRKVNEDIRSLKKRHGIQSEMKWVKISSAKKQAYIDLIDFFFNCEALHFRALIVDNKQALNNEAFLQTHDDWYYKMYFHMLNNVLYSSNAYNIYLDIKDTKSKSKTVNLGRVLANSHYDFSRTMINKIQVIRSHEVEIMQIVDILIGALSYHARGLSGVEAKGEIVSLIQERSAFSLDKSTPLREEKVNILHLQLQNAGGVSYGE